MKLTPEFHRVAKETVSNAVGAIIAQRQDWYPSGSKMRVPDGLVQELAGQIFKSLRRTKFDKQKDLPAVCEVVKTCLEADGRIVPDFLYPGVN